MKKIFSMILMIFIIFNSCKKNNEESEFLRIGNKRARMYGDWVIDKVYGQGQDLTDSFLINMPNFTYSLADKQIGSSKFDSYYYELFIQNKIILFFGPLFYGTDFIVIPILSKEQTDSIINGLPMIYKKLSYNYTVKSVERKKITIALYTSKYQEIILRKL